VGFIGEIDQRLAAIEVTDAIEADRHLFVDKYSGSFIRVMVVPPTGPWPAKVDFALATVPGVNGVVYPTLGDIAGGAAVYADFAGTLGRLYMSDDTGVYGSTLKEWIRKGSIATVHRDDTDPAHPKLVVEKIEQPTAAGSSMVLDSLKDVSAPPTTPAGKVLGTTAEGAWGPVDAPSGGGDPADAALLHGLIEGSSVPEWDAATAYDAWSVVLHQPADGDHPVLFFTPRGAAAGDEPPSGSWWFATVETIVGELDRYQTLVPRIEAAAGSLLGRDTYLFRKWNAAEVYDDEGYTVFFYANQVFTAYHPNAADLPAAGQSPVTNPEKWVEIEAPRPPFWQGTQAAYDALATKDPNVLYVITGA
jgi:hypothetical protein